MRFALAGVVFNGKFWALGGKRPGEWLNTVEIYDPATDSSSGGAPMPVVRSHHNAVTDDQRIYVMGGKIFVSQGHSGGGILATTEAYSLPMVVYLMEKN